MSSVWNKLSERKIDLLETEVNESETRYFDQLMKSSTLERRDFFRREYEIASILRADEFREKFQMELEDTIEFLALRKKDEVPEEEIKFGFSN